MNIAEILKDIIEPILNKDDTYNIALFDSIFLSYNQQANWVEQSNQVRASFLNNQKRAVISTSQSELSSFNGLNHTSFNWTMEVYAKVDDEEVISDLYTLIDNVKDKLITEGGYNVYLTISIPKPSLSSLDSGEYMRTIVIGGAGVISDFATFSTDISFTINSKALGTVLAWSSELEAVGSEFQLDNEIKTISRIDNITNSVAIKLVYDKANTELKKFLKYSLGFATLRGDLVSTFKIDVGSDTTTWTNATILKINTENARGGIVLLNLVIKK